MSKKKMTVDELISFFEMSVKVEGWDNPEPSPSYQAVKAFRELVADRDAARRRACLLEARADRLSHYNGHDPDESELLPKARELAKDYGWDCFDAKEAKA
jgi:hypothetical protein